MSQPQLIVTMELYVVIGTLKLSGCLDISAQVDRKLRGSLMIFFLAITALRQPGIVSGSVHLIDPHQIKGVLFRSTVSCIRVVGTPFITPYTRAACGYCRVFNP